MKAATQTSTIPRAFTLAGLPQRSGQGQGYCRDTERGGNEENDMHAIDEDFRATRDKKNSVSIKANTPAASANSFNFIVFIFKKPALPV